MVREIRGVAGGCHELVGEGGHEGSAVPILVAGYHGWFLNESGVGVHENRG